jgi:hypothetical protein
MRRQNSKLAQTTAIFYPTNPLERYSSSFRPIRLLLANGVATSALQQVFIIARHLDFRRS